MGEANFGEKEERETLSGSNLPCWLLWKRCFAGVSGFVFGFWSLFGSLPPSLRQLSRQQLSEALSGLQDMEPRGSKPVGGVFFGLYTYLLCGVAGGSLGVCIKNPSGGKAAELAVRNTNKGWHGSCLLFWVLASPGKRACNERHRIDKLLSAAADAGIGRRGLRARLQGQTLGPGYSCRKATAGKPSVGISQGVPGW